MSLRVIDICKKKGMTQTDLADQIGMSRVGLAKAIGGNPTKETLEKIASALEVEIWELFTKSQSKDELTALIDHKGEFYKASTIAELEEIISQIKEKQQKI